MNAKQLKNSILQYAIQGKLVPQNLSDDSAFINLNNAMLERAKAIENKKLKNETLAPINEEEIKDKLPVNWAYARLPFICENINGAIRRGPFGSSITKSMFIPKGENTFKVFEQGNAIRKTLDYGDYYISKEDFVKLSSFEVKEGDILISCAGTIGEAYILPVGTPKGIINQALMKLSINENIMLKEFFLIVFETLGRTINENAKGSAMKNLASLKYLKNEVVFPIPPLEEQRRIIDRTKAINLKLEVYDQKEKLRLENLKKFPVQMEKSILQSAMQGKLVEQQSTDEPAIWLIERIKAEKEQLVKENVIKKEKTLPPITEEEIPFEISETWEWVRLEEVAQIIMGQAPKGDTVSEVYTDGSIEFHQGKSNFGEKFLGSSNKYAINPNKVIDTECIVMSVRAPVGDVNLLDRTISIGRGLSALIPYSGIDREYLFYILKNIKPIFESKATGSTFKAINGNIIKMQLIPIPPFEEQKRIIKKIKKLLEAKEKLIVN
ncbi:TPA: restriction endonuclease subunit S [Bacillus toyonensis]|nr:restriction endonuclease subunit S [Bacillus toyonensis]